MEARVKIEVDNNQNGGSSGISQQTLEDAATAVAGAGGNVGAVLPGGKRPASCFVDDSCRESLESEEGQWPLRWSFMASQHASIKPYG